jgi:uncharacterized protein (DUF1778 family)
MPSLAKKAIDGLEIVRQYGVQLGKVAGSQGELVRMGRLSESARPSKQSMRASIVRDRAQYRPTAEQKELLVRAASLTGQSLSDFMRTAVEERAQRVIADHERIVLSGQGRETFLVALANPPQPNDRLTALMERYAGKVVSRS